MADVLNEKDDDDIVVVETDGEEAAQTEAHADDKEDEDDDEARMGTSEDDSDDEIVDKTKKNRDSRVKRRQLQKAAKERADRELAYLRQQNSELMRRMSAVEGNTLTQNAAGVQQHLQQALAEARQAEQIMARAIEAGNGEDAATALRIRDEAKERAAQLSAYKDRFEAAAKELAKVPGIALKSATYVSLLPVDMEYDRALTLGDGATAEAKENAAKKDEKPQGGGFRGMMGAVKAAAENAAKQSEKPSGKSAPPKQSLLMTVTDDVKSITRGAVPAEMFAPPADYKEVKRP